MVKNDMSRGMPRAVQYCHRMFSHGDVIAVLKPSIGNEGLRLRKTESLALFRHRVEPEFVFNMRAFQRNAEVVGQLARTSCVIEMGMGEQYPVDCDLVLGQQLPDAIKVAAGVYHHAARVVRIE